MMHHLALLAITVALLGGLAWAVARMSLPTARRLWLVAFTLVLGGGVTAMVAHSFVAKTAFKGDSTLYGLQHMIDGDAYRPFVYRRLIPDLIGEVSRVVLPRLPESAIRYVVDASPLKRYRHDYHGLESWDAKKAVEFHVAYVVVWLALFGTLLAGAALLKSVRRCSTMEALATSMLGVALIPLMFVQGGYLYDAPELLFWTSLLVAARRGWLVLTPFIFLLMVANKESALVAVPALFPIFLGRTTPTRALAWTAGLGAIGVFWLFFVRSRFAGCAGQPMESWFWTNLEFWSNPASYFKASQLYSPGLLTPQGGNILLLFFAFFPVRFGWPLVPPDIRWAAVIMTVILVPLFITSCYMDEVRNLSFLFPLLFVIDVQGVHALFRPKVAEDEASLSAGHVGSGSQQ
jgi:hypothetical protein